MDTRKKLEFWGWGAEVLGARLPRQQTLLDDYAGRRRHCKERCQNRGDTASGQRPALVCHAEDREAFDDDDDDEQLSVGRLSAMVMKEVNTKLFLPPPCFAVNSTRVWPPPWSGGQLCVYFANSSVKVPTLVGFGSTPRVLAQLHTFCSPNSTRCPAPTRRHRKHKPPGT